jgi:hypothetical protein
MTDRNKFEEMLERLVNEDREGAEALFHEIVVEKSRDIYESLLEDEEVEETTDEEVDEATDEEVDESEEDLDEATDEEVDEATDEEVDEAADEDLDEADEEVDENFFGDEVAVEGDPVDDMMGDVEDPDMAMEPEMGDDDMGMGDEEGDVEDRVADLEDELEALKAEFEAMMGDEEPGDEEPADDMPMDMDSEEGEDDEAEEEAIAFEDEEVEEAADEEVEESKAPKSQTEIMREYTDKVTATMGDNGANTKSTVAGKNDMGGTTANIAKGGDGGAGGTAGGLAQPSTKEDNAGNVNVPGAKGATKMASQPGHGAEKKGKPETADKGAGSPLNGAPKRAK